MITRPQDKANHFQQNRGIVLTIQVEAGSQPLMTIIMAERTSIDSTRAHFYQPPRTTFVVEPSFFDNLRAIRKLLPLVR